MLVAHCTMKNVLWLFGYFNSKFKAMVLYTLLKLKIKIKRIEIGVRSEGGTDMAMCW
jgi:hypothetical protein